MGYIFLVYQYTVWHYSRAYYNILNKWINAFWFTYHFFSIGILFLTLFSPWRRIHEQYRKDLGLSEFFSSLLVNIVMRIVGAVIKTLIIIIGLVMLVAVLIVGIVFLIAWTLMPIVLTLLITRGISMI